MKPYPSQMAKKAIKVTFQMMLLVIMLVMGVMGMRMHLYEETPGEENSILSIEGVPPKQLKMLHLNTKNISDVPFYMDFQFSSPSGPRFCPPVE